MSGIQERKLNKIIKGLCQSAKLLIVGIFWLHWKKKMVINKKCVVYLTSPFFLRPFKSYLYGVWELRATILTPDTQTKNGSANDLMMTLKLHFESHSISKMSWHFYYSRIPQQKRILFSIRNRMYDLPINFSSNKRKKTLLCICKEEENMKHIYECAVLNRNPLKYEFNKIYNGKLLEQIEIMERLRKYTK